MDPAFLIEGEGVDVDVLPAPFQGLKKTFYVGKHKTKKIVHSRVFFKYFKTCLEGNFKVIYPINAGLISD